MTTHGDTGWWAKQGPPPSWLSVCGRQNLKKDASSAADLQYDSVHTSETSYQKKSDY